MSAQQLIYLTDEKKAKDIPPGIRRLDVAEAFLENNIKRCEGWIVTEIKIAKELAHKVEICDVDLVAHLKDIVLLIDAKPSQIKSSEPMLETAFKYTLWMDSKTDLSLEEIKDIQNSDHPEDYVISGTVDEEAKIVTLYRGDFSPIFVSFKYFKPSGMAEPDFKKFKVVDHGTAIQLGKYEASIYPILYERDASYRKRVNAQRKAEEKTFGACLYRARHIMELNQDDFKGVPRETINRIELGKTKKIRTSTKEAILKALGLKSEEELLSY